ncbi:deleted in malignant brain tumors 1 protein-like isoform X2 [Pomacea canaliculata]|uniref:deleted in malignant brain tumors 1 protein-like isoform X2 n=1 Tax=Pomacea canaliculata TaxID=400727 RepID=UPI000D733440|nr:deleted in malignant brain tumors 1 protein-like isoform X2 [Pomacea canaliculata]
MALVMLLLVSATICLTQISPSTSQSVCDNSPLFPSVGQVNYLTSPNFPRSYENNVNCGRLINAPSGYVVKVTVLNTFMELGCDYVQLFDGPSQASPSLARFSIMPSSTVYFSSGQSMYIKFFTDSSVVSSGFRLSYEVIPTPTSVCSYNAPTLVATPGYDNLLTSPNYPSQYGKLNCRWIIEAPRGYVVQVTILNLNLELCCDYVDLLNGAFHPNTLLRRFSSMPSVTTYFSSGQRMNIWFLTDGSVTNTGFRLQYRAVPPSARHG